MGKRLVTVLFVSTLLLAAGAACGGSDDTKESTTESTPAVTAAAVATTAPTPAGPQVIEIKAGDYYFEPKDLTARPGSISVKMTNDGPERPHTFVVRNLNKDGDLVKSERVQVGQSATIEFTVSEEGTYEVYCSLQGHADRGQVGSLTVKRA